MLSSPTFIDRTGYFPLRTIDTEFFVLNESLKLLRRKFGDEKYAEMVKLSDRMRAHFEADPEDKTEDALKGRDCLLEMEDIIRSLRRKPSPDSLPRQD